MSNRSARDRIQVRRGQQRRQTQTILIIVVAVLALGVVGLLILFNQPPNEYQAGNYDGIPESVDQTGGIGLVLGPADAPVSLTEYSDFSCPHCHDLEPTIQQLITDYVKPGKLKIVYKPVTFVGGQFSEAAARGVICAASQGKAWEMHDRTWELYASNSYRAFTADRIAGLASGLSLDMGQFNSCYSSQDTTKAVNSVTNEVQAIGVNSTPTLFIDGKLLDYTGPDSLIQAIADKVAAAGG